MTEKVILSTDIGTDIDDALALYLAAQSPEISLEGVYVTNGNVNLRAKVAKKLLNMIGHEATVGIGEAEPFDGPQPYHNGYESLFFNKKDHKRSLKTWGIEENGLDSMIEKLDGATVASIAPLTNLASILRRDPSIAKKAKSLYIMGGREGQSEHNFFHDMKAAQEVLDSDFAITIVPADVCEKFELDADYLCDLKGSSAKRYIAKMAGAWRLHQEMKELRSIDIKRIISDIEIANPHFCIDFQLRGSLDLIMNYKNYLKDYNSMSTFYKIFRAGVQFDDSSAGQIIAHTLKECECKAFRVSDAFVIYSILHPEKTERKRVEVKVGEGGKMSLHEGNKHELVTDVDYADFERFVLDGLK